MESKVTGVLLRDILRMAKKPLSEVQLKELVAKELGMTPPHIKAATSKALSTAVEQRFIKCENDLYSLAPLSWEYLQDELLKSMEEHQKVLKAMDDEENDDDGDDSGTEIPHEIIDKIALEYSKVANSDSALP